MALADTFKALSDPARREILELLKNGPLPAGEIARNFDMTQATVSYHLRRSCGRQNLIREEAGSEFYLLRAEYDNCNRKN
ncbi:MAG: metalloregulator ArsR/SmtB family transcription factor [Lachnospiraceae bacterium]